jgi:hypothetical protein
MLAGTAAAIEISAAGGPPVAASGRERRPHTIFCITILPYSLHAATISCRSKAESLRALYYYPSIFFARRDDFTPLKG